METWRGIPLPTLAVTPVMSQPWSVNIQVSDSGILLKKGRRQFTIPANRCEPRACG
jgi:hypothetical protein